MPKIRKEVKKYSKTNARTNGYEDMVSVEKGA